MRRHARFGLAVGGMVLSAACADASAPGVGSAPVTSAASAGAAVAPSATATAAPSAWSFPPDPASSAEVAALQEALRAIRPQGAPIKKHLLPHEHTQPGSPIDRLPERPCDPSFCVRAIEDDVDHLRAVFAEHAPPAGVELAREDVVAGLGPPRGRWFLLAAAPAPESLEEVAALAAAALPPGRALVWGPAAGAPAGALRSYVVGPAIVDAADLASATKTADGVQLVLRPAGKARFAEATAALDRRRIALLTAGRVVSAPLVMSPITGGRLTLGVSPEEADRLLVTIAPR